MDLLIDPDQLASARQVALATGFVPIGHRGPGCSLLAYHAPTESWIHIDLATQIAPADWGIPRSFVAGCLASRSGQPPRLAAADRFWSLIVHLVEDRRRPALRHREQLMATVAAAGLETRIPATLIRRVPAAAAPMQKLEQAVRVRDWSAFEAQLDLLDAMWARGRRARVLASAVKARIGSLASAWPYRGVSVALLGPDGAGKSTLAAGLASRTFFPVRVVYMGTGSGGATTVRPRAVRHLRGPGLYFVGGIATQWLRYLSALGERLRGRVVVFDRYSEEALLPARPSDPGWRRITRRLRRMVVCPPPELAIVLDAPGAVMFERKGEHTAAILESERRRYRTLSAQLPNVCVLDAERGSDELSREAVEQLWMTYARRAGSHVAAAGAWEGAGATRG